MTDDERSSQFSPYLAVHAEGQRVGIMSCLECGAAILISSTADAPTIHEQWHASMRDGEQ